MGIMGAKGQVVCVCHLQDGWGLVGRPDLEL